MRQAESLGWKLCVLASLTVSLPQCASLSDRSEISASLKASPSTENIAQPTLITQDWPDSSQPAAHVGIVTIPPNYPVGVAVSEDLKTVTEFAAETDAFAVLNGGFFDPNNAQTTSFITIDGVLVADPRNNQQLVNNPDLAEYIDQILNRSEFRRYDCVDGLRYDITVRQTAVPDGCALDSALGAGPQLLPKDTSQAEGFTDSVDGMLVRDAVGSQQRNARSAIGIKQDGSLVWVMAAQPKPTGGMTLVELAEFMRGLGVTKALNLDGGSSSSLYLEQQRFGATPNSVYFSASSASQTLALRPVKSVLYLSMP